MKKLSIIFVILNLAFTVFAQEPKWSGLKLLASKSFDYSGSIYTDRHDNYYITGSFPNGRNIGTLIYDKPTFAINCELISLLPIANYTGFLFRFDSVQNLNLSIFVDGATLGEVLVDESENMYISGKYMYGASGDGFIKKYSKTGNLLWTKMVQSYTLNGYATDGVVGSIDLCKDGSIIAIVLSYGEQTSAFGKTIYGQGSFIVKLFPDGDVQWVNKITSTIGFGVSKIEFDDYGNVLAGGNESVNTYGTFHAFLLKLDKATGNIVWKKDFKGNGLFIVSAIKFVKNIYYFGGYFGKDFKTGDSIFLSSNNSNIFILQCDTSGNILWVNIAGGPGSNKISDIAVAATNDIYVTGSYSDGFKINNTIYTSKGNSDVFIFSLDSSGLFKWMKTGGSNIPAHNGDWFYNEFGSSISIDSKNQIHILGETIGSGNFGNLKFQVPEESGKNVFWLTLGEKDSSYTVFSSCTESVVVDSIFSISVYPNPFIQSVNINNLKKENSYNITFSNSIGQVLSKRTVSNTSNSVFNLLHSAATGIYFLNITSKEFSKTFKLIKQ